MRRGGGPIFNTGVYPNKTTRVVMTFKKDKTSGNQVFFGVRSGGFEFVNFTDATDGTMMSFRFGSGTAHTINPTGYVIGEKATLDFGPAGAFLDGREIVSSATLAKSANNNTSSMALALFTLQDGTKGKGYWYDEWARAWQGYCYDFKVYQGDSCVLRYYPCLDSDGTACFYDAVSKSLVYRATDYTTPKYDQGTLTLSAIERDDIRINDGTVEFKVTASVNEPILGSVSVASGWCVGGGSFALTATPAAGATFSHWEGDVDAITSGTATDATVSVSPTVNAVSLKAVFAGMGVENRILKIYVPAGMISTDDYTPYLADVTNVVKSGAGTLVSKSSSNYRGDWTIAEGVFEYTTADAFGQVVASDDTPVVRVLDGAQIYHNANNLALYRTIRLAGSGPNGTGAYRFLSQSGGDYGVQYVKIFLDADATVGTGNRHALNTGAAVDCMGHKLSITGYQCNIPINCSFTNSSETPAVVSTASASYSKYFWNAETTGGPQNTVAGDTGRFYAYQAVSAYDPDAWTFVFNGTTSFRSNVRGLNVFTRGWEGPVRVDKDAKFLNEDGSAAGDVGYASTLWGPLSGSADRTITVTRSIVNVCNANNDYAGAWVLAGGGTADYHNTLVFANGANWCGKSLAMTDSDLILDAAVDRALPAVTVDTKDTFTGVTGSAKIAGGTAGTTIASIAVTGPNAFTLDSPATVGELNVASGTLVLADAGAKIAHLVLAAGTTVNCGGHDFEIEAISAPLSEVNVINGRLIQKPTPYTIADRVLTISTPPHYKNFTNDFDYVSLLAPNEITNVVYKGPGILVARAAPNYTGDFHVEGGVILFKVANAFGATGTATDSCGKVYVHDGATIMALDGCSGNALAYKDVYVAGDGAQVEMADPLDAAKGAICGVHGNHAYFNSYLRVHLMDDATIYCQHRSVCFQDTCVIDTCGHNLNAKCYGANCNFQYFYGAVVTNSNDEAASTVVMRDQSTTKFQINSSKWKGGARNVLVFDSSTDHFYLNTKVEAADCWTLRIGRSNVLCGGAAKAPGDDTYAWGGPVEFTSAATSIFRDNSSGGYSLSLLGDMTGVAGSTILLQKGFHLNIGSPVNTYKGIWDLSSGRYVSGTVTNHPVLTVYDNAQISGREIRMKDAELVLGTATAYEIPPVVLVGGTNTISGGLEGSALVSVATSEGSTLVLDTPASIGSLDVAENVTVDCGGAEVQVLTMTGAEPIVVNGTLKVVGGAAGTWNQPAAGGKWMTAANWVDDVVAGSGTATFPKATAANVPVDVDAPGFPAAVTVQTGTGTADDKTGDWYVPFGYVFGGAGAFCPLSETVYTFLAGRNALNTSIHGSGVLSINAALYPYTNLTTAAYSSLSVGADALAGFTGTLKVNVDGTIYHAPVTLDTTKFGGSLETEGKVEVNSLEFVRNGGTLTLTKWGEFAYTGPATTIPALTLNPNSGNAIVVSNAGDVAVETLTVSRTDSSLLKRGAGAFRILGTNTCTFAPGYSPAQTVGFNVEQGVHFGVAPGSRRGGIEIADGALEIGVKDDPANAPTVTTTDADQFSVKTVAGYNGNGICLGNAWSQSHNPTLRVNNGTVTVPGTLSPGMYTGYAVNGWSEPADSVHTVEVNGGSLTVGCVFSRLGNLGWPRGTHVYTVNGGTFTVKGFFNLTQLSPGDPTTEARTYKTGNPRTFSINGGEFSAQVFRMAYTHGWSWDSKSTSSSYGHGPQPDSYLNVNEGTFTVSEFLLANDRSDSDSWINLNGGTMKVNLLTNTTATAVFTFNGGTLAPLGKADYATTEPGGKFTGVRVATDDILKFKGFKSAVVSAGGAVIDTSLMADTTQTYAIEQALVHDATLDGADGGLVKKGAGTLALTVANTFDGPVAVEGGALALQNRNAIGKKTPVSLAADAKIAVPTGVVKCGVLAIGGVAMEDGTYGSSASAAEHKDDVHFSGGGVLRVGPPGIIIVVE